MAMEGIAVVLMIMLLEHDVEVETVVKLDDELGIAGDVERLGRELELPSEHDGVVPLVDQGEGVLNLTEIGVLCVGKQVPNA